MTQQDNHLRLMSAWPRGPPASLLYTVTLSHSLSGCVLETSDYIEESPYNVLWRRG